MNNEQLSHIIEQVISRSDIKSTELPDLDLYIDQIMTLFDQRLVDNKRHEDDKLLTKTMINNYSKAKLLSPVKGKKYTKEQIIQMLVIYQLKNMISMQEIKTLLTPLYEDDLSLQNQYDAFIDIKQNENNKLKDFLTQLINDHQFDISKKEDLLSYIMILSSLSFSLERIVEKLIDELDDE